MKILYSAAGTPIPGTHGGSVHALELCRALARRGHEVHLACLPGTPAPVDLDGVMLHALRRFLPVSQLEFTAARQLRTLVAALRPDVVIERFYTFGGAAINAAHAAGVPAVLEVNSPAREYPGSTRDLLDRLTLVRPVERWRRRQLMRAAAIYTTSRHLLPPALQAAATVIVNGVDVERFQPGPPAPDEGPLRCAYVSSFRSWHGAEDLVAAVAQCAALGVPLHVTCVGAGPRWKDARVAAARAGIGEHIEFTGRVPHDAVPRLLAHADVGVAPFAPEQFRALELGWFWSPIKIFEYLAAGLPVVTVDIPELRALLPDAVACFYQAAAPQGLAGVLGGLAADRAAVRRMGGAARALAVQKYTWDQQATAVERVLEDAVQ